MIKRTKVFLQKPEKVVSVTYSEQCEGELLTEAVMEKVETKELFGTKKSMTTRDEMKEVSQETLEVLLSKY